MPDKFLTETESDLFSASLTRCLSHPEFLDRFYELFMESSAEVREKFKSTDWEKQKRMIKASFHMLMLGAEAKPEGQMHLERMAHRHGHAELNISAYHYELWLECLMVAVHEFDPRCTPETAAVWQKVMRRGIDYMKAHY